MFILQEKLVTDEGISSFDKLETAVKFDLSHDQRHVISSG